MFNTIASVDPGSPLEGKVLPGDQLRYVNHHPIRDVLDYKYWTYDKKLVLEFQNAGTIRLRKEAGRDRGLNFETYLMDKPTGCANKCVFCFIDQLPKGLRPTLYFKDADARLSFLTGNYITCTNLSERELQRICDLRISPLNISVHATDPELRCRLLGNRRGGEIMNILRRFSQAGIFMECQIVCVPGWNDGEALLRTMRDLSGFYPQVESVSIVPVGLTKHREGLPELTPFTPEHAAETIAQLVDDPTVVDMDDLADRVRGISGYASVNCYTLPGPEEGSYMVFVEVSERIEGILETVSGLDGFYVRPNEKDELKVVLGEISDDVQIALNELFEREDVSELIDSVNKRFAEELGGSEELQEYFRNLWQSSAEG